MRWMACSPWLMITAACSLYTGDGSDDGAVIPPPPESKEFDLDVEVRPSSLTLSLRHFPTDSFLHVPHVGECAYYGDFVECLGEPTMCLTRVAVEREFNVLAAVALDGWCRGAGSVDVPGLIGPGTELVVEGCGGAARIPLPETPAPSTEIDDLTTDREWLYASWTSDGTPTGVQAHISYWVQAAACLADATMPARVPLIGPSTSGPVWTRAVVLEHELATPGGNAWVWNTEPYDGFTEAVAPAPPEPPLDGWWIASYSLSSVSFSLDDVTSGIDRIAFRETATGVRIGLVGDGWEYRAGERLDSLRVVTADGAFAGTFAHVVPANDLEIGLAGDQHFELAVGPVTLRKEGAPSQTRRYRLVASWDHPYIARPLP